MIINNSDLIRTKLLFGKPLFLYNNLITEIV